MHDLILQANFKSQLSQFDLDVSLTLNCAGVTAIFGPSGSGKTTLLRCIAGLEKNIKGSLSIGNEIFQSDSSYVAAHRRPIGYVFQEPSLFEHLNVAENINFARKRATSAVTETEYQQIIELLDLLPLLKNSASQLSGGEKQRIAIARALLVKPKLLLMDEPLASLDSARKNQILNYLEKLSGELKVPIIYVSHSIQEVTRLADYLVILQQGKITNQGDIKSIFRETDIIRQHTTDAFSVLFGQVLQQRNAFDLTEVLVDQLLIKMPQQKVIDGEQIRLKIDAKDVSVALQHEKFTSILNIFPAKIVAINEIANSGQCEIKLALERQFIFAKISQFSCQKLNLNTNDTVFAQVKAISIVH